jgi:uncharacterized circularly permuted ATP-grasp superfamily protein
MISEPGSLNKAYRRYFLDHPQKVRRDLERLDRYLLEHRCIFRGVAMPTLLKPNFLSPAQAELLKGSVETMSRALTRVISLFLEDSRVQEIMGFSAMEHELFRIDPGYSNPLVISRLDAFLLGDGIKFLEFNCDSPAGIAYSDILEEGFRASLEEYPFMDGFRVEYIHRQKALLSSLLECYGEFRSRHPHFPERPVIAIVDWKDVSTYSEFELHRDHFRSMGIEAVIASPLDFSIRDGRAHAGDREVHLVYRRVITGEIIARRNEAEPFLEAIREGLVCCCNSFRSFIVGNKKILSVITDPRFISVFSPEEQELIRKTVPWTRVLADRKEKYRNREVNLKTFIPENRESLVLKPSNKYGGKDVYIGLETPQQKWEEIMNEHIEREMWVVQEYVDIPTGEFPEFGGRLHFRKKYVNINPFALNGSYSGTITRISDRQVINVSAGGGLVPTLTVSGNGD